MPVKYTPKKPTVPESDIQASIVTWVKYQYPQTVLSAVPNSSPYAQILINAIGEKQAKIIISRIVNSLRRIGMCPGFPDLIWLYQVRRTALFECKSKSGRLEESQQDLHPKINALGHPVYIVRSLEAFQTIAKQLMADAEPIGGVPCTIHRHSDQQGEGAQ